MKIYVIQTLLLNKGIVYICRSNKWVLTVTVDQSGKGNYTRIQDAIKSVPVPGSSRSAGWVLIKIMPGTYRQVNMHLFLCKVMGMQAKSSRIDQSARVVSSYQVSRVLHIAALLFGASCCKHA